MRLSWAEIRANAAAFAAEWKDAGYEKGQTQLFYQAFFKIFDVPVQRVAKFEHAVQRIGDKQGFIDLFWPRVLLVEQKSAGRDLTRALSQAESYFTGLKSAEWPRYILLSDFQTFELYDRDGAEDPIAFRLEDLPAHVERFGFVMGVQKRVFRDQDPVNIRASEKVGALHDALKAAGYEGHDLERFLVRIVFCLFADDTGVFDPRDLFLDLVEATPAADLGAKLSHLFQVLDTPPEKRGASLAPGLAAFPYVNGALFQETLRIPDFDDDMRTALIEAAEFDWSAISPAIFGALFQSVMSAKERRALGAHYTTEKNIMKVIGPLFLDDLRAEFEKLKARRDGRRKATLLEFQDRLGRLTFLDPACGCGNFLIIAYRELRALEIEVLREVYDDGQMQLAGDLFSTVTVDQFYGIEFEEFPARIAETALWMMDHIMNNRLSLTFGRVYVRIPLTQAPHIRHADALEMDWADLIAPEACDYILGNPPFIGAKYQSVEQRAQVRRIADLGKSGGTLDYVAAWFILAGAFAKAGGARIGFVSTNSISQGEQVAQLWPILFDRYGLEIAFAHRTFAWGSDARGMAHVHVVVIGLVRMRDAPAQRRLFSYEGVKGEADETQHAAISPYLFDASGLANPHLVARETSKPINGLPKMIIGSKPIDGGHYIFTDEEKAAFVASEPDAEPYLRPFIGSREFINGGRRWILALHGAEPAEISKMPTVRERIQRVRDYRSDSNSKPTQELAETPVLYHVNVIPKSPFLVVPEVSSERRRYVPVGYMDFPTIPSNLVKVVLNCPLYFFAIINSLMNMSWLRDIGGRLKSDYRYSSGLVYNTFPMPPVPQDKLDALAPLGQAVLDARANHPDATLADLYDPDLMPADLRKAHQALDRAVDRLYRKAPFANDRERVEHLFGLYEKMVAPLEAAAARKRRRKRAAQ